jgi:rhodanese-related sulfurtransferase
MCAMAAGAQGRKTLDELLEEARASIERLEPPAALKALDRGALLIDIRSSLDRERDGVVPGSLYIPRTVLEWRLDPDGEWRNPRIGSLDQQIIIICDHGFSSILAAGTLAELGFKRSGDVIGGFAAWRAAGLPTAQATPARREADELAGMGGPEPLS